MDILDYIPNSFVEYPFTGVLGNLPPESATDEWLDAYHEYLRFVKDSKFGRVQCADCILNSKLAIKSTSLRDFMVDGMKEINPQFPCTIVNIFKCPYGEKNDTLLSAGIVWQVLHQALHHAGMITSEFDDTYHVDYKEGWTGSRPDMLSSRIEESLGMIILPQVPVRTKNDIYEILTKKKKLERLIDQYIDSIERKIFRIYKSYVGESKFDLGWLKKSRDSIIEFFSEMKNSVKIDKIGDLHAEEFAEKEDLDALKPQARPGNCLICGSVAKIHCVNCDSWVCLDHWREHGIKVHNYVPNEKK